MSHTLITVHGNPGYAECFDNITSNCQHNFDSVRSFKLDKSKKFKIEDAFQQLDSLRGNSEKISFLTYSFGTYLAIHYLKSRNALAETFVSLNPTVTSKEGMSGLIGGIASTPVLNKVFFGLLSGKLVADFCDKSFAPEEISTEAEVAFTRNLSNAETWIRAIEVKNYQHANPLNVDAQFAKSFLALVGTQDTAVSIDDQQDELNRIKEVSDYKLINIGGAGHALPWTQFDNIKTHIESIWRS